MVEIGLTGRFRFLATLSMLRLFQVSLMGRFAFGKVRMVADLSKTTLMRNIFLD